MPRTLNSLFPFRSTWSEVSGYRTRSVFVLGHWNVLKVALPPPKKKNNFLDPEKFYSALARLGPQVSTQWQQPDTKH